MTYSLCLKMALLFNQSHKLYCVKLSIARLTEVNKVVRFELSFQENQSIKSRAYTAISALYGQHAEV